MRKYRGRICLALLALTVLALALVGVLRSNDDLSVKAPDGPRPAATNLWQTEWKPAVATMDQGIVELFTTPDVARVDQFVDPTCGCYQAIRASVADLQKRGVHYDRSIRTVRGITLLSQPEPGVLEVMVKSHYTPARLLDNSGKVVTTEQEFDGDVIYRVKQTTGGTWRLAYREQPDSPPS